MTDEILAYDDQPEPNAAGEHEKPEGMDHADRHARWARIERTRAADLKAVYDAELARLTELRDRTIGYRTNAAEGHERAVEAWHRSAHAAGEVGLTVDLPNGTSKLAKAQPAYVVDDVEELRAQAMLRGLEDDVFPAKDPTLNRNELKKLVSPQKKTDLEPGEKVPAVLADGTILEGVEIVGQPRNHKLSEPKENQE